MVNNGDNYPNYPRPRWDETKPAADNEANESNDGSFPPAELSRSSPLDVRGAMINNTGAYPSYPRQQWDGNRPVTETVPNDGSYVTSEESARNSLPCVRAASGPPFLLTQCLAANRDQTIPNALRDYCHIHAQSFFLAVDTGGGNMVYYGGPHPFSEDQISKMFSRNKFLQLQSKPGGATALLHPSH